MSQLPGRTTSADNSNTPAGSDSPFSSTAASPSSRDATSSLSALASGTRPRQSLTSLGAIGKGSSLAGLASRNEGSKTNGSSLQDLSKGTNGGLGSGITRTPGSLTQLTAASSGSSKDNNSLGNLAGGSAPTRTSLGSLAGSRNSLLSTSSLSTTGSTSSDATTISSAGSSSPTLSQLAAAGQNVAPRRSLASLAASSQSSAPVTTSSSPSSTGFNRASVGLTPRSGGISGLARLGGTSSGTLLRPTAPDSTKNSPSLSTLASGSSQQRSPLSLVDPSKRTSDPSPATTEQVTPASVSSSTKLDATSPSATSRVGSKATAISSFMEASIEVVDQESYQPDIIFGDTNAPFSSLIGSPSHFAISIFERLDPVPSPIALSTASILKSDPELLRTILGSSTFGAMTPSRIFRFDVPSPDDIVFKAQGHRPTATRT